jgi:hypothetical protein
LVKKAKGIEMIAEVARAIHTPRQKLEADINGSLVIIQTERRDSSRISKENANGMTIIGWVALRMIGRMLTAAIIAVKTLNHA